MNKIINDLYVKKFENMRQIKLMRIWSISQSLRTKVQIFQLKTNETQQN